MRHLFLGITCSSAAGMTVLKMALEAANGTRLRRGWGLARSKIGVLGLNCCQNSFIQTKNTLWENAVGYSPTHRTDKVWERRLPTRGEEAHSTKDRNVSRREELPSSLDSHSCANKQVIPMRDTVGLCTETATLRTLDTAWVLTFAAATQYCCFPFDLPFWKDRGEAKHSIIKATEKV